MSERSTPASRREGVSLVEVLMAVAILAILLIPVLNLFQAGARGLKMTREEVVGQQAGAELMEQAMTIPYDLLPTGEFSHQMISDGLAWGNTAPFRFHISPATGTVRQMRISEVALEGGLRAKKVEVTVALTGTGGQVGNRVIAFKTLMTSHE